jgi:hypothetical protein
VISMAHPYRVSAVGRRRVFGQGAGSGISRLALFDR